ncbi:hypothetical protein LQW54_006910 [Pestalotiopsis sp. IQ-011]
MNHTATAYTPLESLFLFQLLAKHGLVAEAFQRISDELTQNAFIKLQTTYNVERLGPEKLEQLARRLFREDQVREAEAAEKTTNGGILSPTSRKRKLPSPSLPSLKELQAHADKLPQLVDRLHANYQADIVRQIRLDEEYLERLEREVTELEAPPRPLPPPPASVASATASPVSRQEPIAARPNGAPPPTDTKSVQPPRPNGQPSHTPVPPPVAQAHAIPKPGSTPQPQLASQPPLDRKPSQASPSPIPAVVRPPGEAYSIPKQRRHMRSLRVRGLHSLLLRMAFNGLMACPRAKAQHRMPLHSSSSLKHLETSNGSRHSIPSILHTMVSLSHGRRRIRINHNQDLLTHTRIISLSILIPSSTRTNILSTRSILSIRSIRSTRNILNINTLSTLSPSMATGRPRNRIYSLICNLGERPLQAVVNTLNPCWYLPRDLCKMLARRLRHLGNLIRMCPYSRRSHIGTQRLMPAGLLLRLRSLRPNMHTSSLHITQDSLDRGSKSCLHRCNRLAVGIPLVRR